MIIIEGKDGVIKALEETIKVPKKTRKYVAKIALEEAIKITPVRTGNLQKNWRLRHYKNKSEVYNTVKYGVWVDYGTGIYVDHDYIRPKTKPYLVFRVNGHKVVTKKVKGQKPQRLIDNTIKNAEKRVGFAFDRTEVK